MLLNKLKRLLKSEWRNYYFWLYTSKGKHPKEAGHFFVHGRMVQYGDCGAFLGAYSDIFAAEIYDFQPSTDAPVILDIGANVGIATIWWKLRFPKARIVAIEADPAIFAILEGNIKRFGFDGVELVNAAAWVTEGVLKFQCDGSDGGRVSDNGIEVRAISLASVIDRFENVDLLKLDIEGGERVVLPSIEKSLGNVDTLFCEYHSSVSVPQLLEEILATIGRAGFRYHIRSLLVSDKPFIKITESCGFDNQLNLFCSRR